MEGTAVKVQMCVGYPVAGGGPEIEPHGAGHEAPEGSHELRDRIGCQGDDHSGDHPDDDRDPPHYRRGSRIAIGFEYFSVLVVHLVPVVVFDEKTGCMLISEYVSELPTSSLCSGSSLSSSRP